MVDEVSILIDDNSLLDSSNLQTPKSLKHKAAYVTNDKQLIIEAYKELFNAEFDTSLDENELYDQLVSATSESFEDEADLETRFKYLQKRFSTILHTKEAPFQNMPPFKTEGYKLVFDKVNTIKNMVDSVRTSKEFSLADILECLELCSILSHFCLISIKMGIEENLKAAKKCNPCTFFFV